MCQGWHEVYLSLEHRAPFHPHCLEWKAMWWMGMGWMAVPGPVSTGCLAVTGTIIAIWISEVYFLPTSIRLPMYLKVMHSSWGLGLCWNDDASLYCSYYRLSAFYEYNLNRFNLKNGDNNTVSSCWDIINIIPYVRRTRFLVLGVEGESMLLHTLNAKTKVHLCSDVSGSLG